jgi:hypothetical protein
MTVAWSAYQSFTPVEKARLSVLLKLNPDYATWLSYIPAGTSDADRDMYVFMMAATWPDEIKADGSGYKGTDTAPPDESPALNDGYDAKLAHKYWHFIDTPFTWDSTPLPPVPTPNIAQKIGVFRTALTSNEPDLLKSYDLVWLIHMVGDIHQPLHCSTRVSHGKPHGDEGGNLVTVSGPAKNLHAFWDDVLGVGYTKDFAAAVAVGKTLPVPDALLIWDRDENNWAAESFKLAKNRIYTDPVGPGNGPYNLSGAYTTKAQEIARERIALAGFRLTALLRSALGCDDQSCVH